MCIGWMGFRDDGSMTEAAVSICRSHGHCSLRQSFIARQSLLVLAGDSYHDLAIAGKAGASQRQVLLRCTATKYNQEEEYEMSTIRSASATVQAEQSNPVARRNDLTTWSCMAAAVFLIELCVRGRHGAFGSRGPEIYWAFHWASDYSGGFVRRGLLGATMHIVHLDNTNFQMIMLCSFAISIALYGVFMIGLYRFVRQLSGLEKTLATVVLALSPMTTGMIIETTGDPIQFLMLIFLVLFLLLVVPGRNAMLSAVSFAVLGGISALIHEASIFFILPSLAIAAFLLQKTYVARAAFLGNLIGSTIFTVVIVLATQKATGKISHIPILHYHEAIETMPLNEFPKFSQLLAIENHANFGHGIKGDISTIVRLFGVLVLPAMLICFLTALFYGQYQSSSATRRNIYAAFILSFLLSVPLYIIGHDWGRFSSYSFLLTFTIMSFWRTEQILQPHRERQLPLYLGLVIVGLTLVPLPTGYFLTGMLYSRINFIGEIALICLLVVQSRSYWRANLSPFNTPQYPVSANAGDLSEAIYERRVK